MLMTIDCGDAGDDGDDDGEAVRDAVHTIAPLLGNFI